MYGYLIDKIISLVLFYLQQRTIHETFMRDENHLFIHNNFLLKHIYTLLKYPTKNYWAMS